MKNLITLVQQDIKFQFRQGFYTVYSIITLFYIVILKLLSGSITNIITPLIIFSDPTFIGFFFIGAILFFEREQNVTTALFITPVKIEEYVLAKCISLTSVTLFVSVVIVGVVIGFKINWFLLLFGIISTSFIFILLGMIISNYVKKITLYLLIGGFLISPLALPIFYILGLNSSMLFYILPSTASLKLIFGAINSNISLLDLIYSLLYLTILCIIIFIGVVKTEENKNENI
ncbi:MAG: ABC transporter permease [Spirochaetales bacterium]|nr:ABC transporter permease [Spirochaetales bacterium]